MLTSRVETRRWDRWRFRVEEKGVKERRSSQEVGGGVTEGVWEAEG